MFQEADGDQQCPKQYHIRPNIKNFAGKTTALNPNLSEQFLYNIRGLLEKYPTFGREKETDLLGALDT